MVNIVSTRIDTRFMHRQMTKDWLSSVGANILLVVSNTLMKDPLRQELLKRIAPTHTHIKYCTVREAYLWLCQRNRLWKIAIVCATPYDIVQLVEAGVPIQKVMIGYMNMEEGKWQVTSNIAIDEQDLVFFHRLQKLGVQLEITRFPNNSVEDASFLFKKEW